MSVVLVVHCRLESVLVDYLSMHVITEVRVITATTNPRSWQRLV